MKKLLTLTMVITLLLAICIAVPSAPVVAAGSWSEDWDSYPTGQDMHGVNGWKGWDNDPTYTAFTSNAHSLSAPNSIAIAGDTDLVHEFSGYDSGKWRFTAWQFVPNDFVGESAYYILLNTYQDGGPYEWSTQIVFNSTFNVVVNDDTWDWLPLIKGQWVEIRVDINLDLNYQCIYYNGVLLSQTSWTWGSGVTSIGAIDLYAEESSPVYYDNLSLTELETIISYSVPAVSLWGGMALALLFCGSMVYIIHRRQIRCAS